jgi:hypothetical protein
MWAKSVRGLPDPRGEAGTAWLAVGLVVVLAPNTCRRGLRLSPLAQPAYTPKAAPTCRRCCPRPHPGPHDHDGRLPLFCRITMVCEEPMVKLLLAPCPCCGSAEASTGGGGVLCGRRIYSHCHEAEASNCFRRERHVPHCPMRAVKGSSSGGRGAPSYRTHL